ncbi:MAG: aminoglycoside phosphotransferase family protein [Pseudomonadales bacterium]
MTATDAFCTGWGEPLHVEALGGGHINDTWKVRDAQGTWVLQRINRDVFTNPARVVANTERVIAHCRALPLARLRPTRDARPALTLNGDTWRVCHFVDNTESHRTPPTTAHARAAGDAFGRFQRTLRDLPAPPLQPTIAGFLRLSGYLATFDALDVATEWQPLIDRQRALCDVFSRENATIHADAKFDNLLFACESTEVRAILDLDTVMPGHYAWDFGDLVRSLGIPPDAAMLEALLEGFLPHVSEPDARALTLAPRYMTAMLAIRRLTDHLQGDRYFRVTRRGDNLTRAQALFAQVRWLEDNEAWLRQCVEWALDCLSKT